jgi:hypothetical protein
MLVDGGAVAQQSTGVRFLCHPAASACVAASNRRAVAATVRLHTAVPDPPARLLDRVTAGQLALASGGEELASACIGWL